MQHRQRQPEPTSTRAAHGVGLSGVVNVVRVQLVHSRPFLPATCRAVMLAVVVLFTMPAARSLASPRSSCPADVRAATAVATSLQPAADAGDVIAHDAVAQLQRAHVRCGALRVGVAIAHATERGHASRVGRRSRVDDVQLIATAALGTVVWRYDPLTQAARIAQLARRRPGDGAALVTRFVATAQPSRNSAIRWAADPTAGAVDVRVQLAVASTLANVAAPGARTAARRSLAAFGDTRISRELVGGPVLVAIARTTVLARVSHTLGGSCAKAPVAATCALTATRVRRATTPTWPVVDGQPATAAGARGLQRALDRLAAAAPELKSIAKRRTVLRVNLASPPTIRLTHLPSAAFYPLPTDGVLDTSTIALRSDRPVQLALQVFAASGALADTVVASGGPGALSIAWNGSLAGREPGSAPAGAYRWSVRVRDPLGHRAVLPGIGSLTIARDTTPPKIQSTAVSLTGTGTRRTLHVSWKVDEPISPRISVRLTLRGRAVRRSLAIPAGALVGGGDVSTLLPAGSYRAFVRVTDGAGNATAVAAGTVTAT